MRPFAWVAAGPDPSSNRRHIMQFRKRSFHQLLHEARRTANQSVEVMGFLLNMSGEDYEALESWKYPDEETLKRLCLMMEWNYYDTQRLIINEMISPHREAAPEGEEPEAESARPARPAGAERTHPAAPKTTSMGERLREVRLVTGQSIDIIALMLGIDADHYKRLEEGEHPSDTLLRRISTVYNWNYQDLLAVLKSSQALSFQPAQVGMPYLGASAQVSRVKKIFREMEEVFPLIPDEDKLFVISQLELVRDSMRRHQKAS